MFWQVGPSTHPVDLGNHLQALGFSFLIRVPGMIMELHDLEKAPAASSNFVILPVEDLISEGDKVVVQGRDYFTRQQDGKPVELTWIEILRLEDGKLAEAWVEADMRLLNQITGKYQ